MNSQPSTEASAKDIDRDETLRQLNAARLALARVQFERAKEHLEQMEQEFGQKRRFTYDVSRWAFLAGIAFVVILTSMTALIVFLADAHR